jgi:hypothetical protein
MEQVTGLHRKSLTRLMHAGSLERKKQTTPRPRSYGLEVERVIVRVWESQDYMCAERLTPGLLQMAQHLVRFWKEKVTGVRLSRSRPWHKNDNRMVEQKYDTLVREYLGDLRLDTPEQIAALNALYEDMWLYYNVFQPMLHLCEKTGVGDKVVRKWEEAKTPYERLKARAVLSSEQQARLQQLYEQTSPAQLRESIYRQLAALWQAATTLPTSAA